MIFCDREPVWLYGAIAMSEEECPFDMVKLGSVSTTTGTQGMNHLS